MTIRDAYLWRDVVADGNIQYVLKSSLQVGVVLPVVHVDAVDLLSQCLSTENLNSGRSGEGHEHIELAVVRSAK